MLSRISTLAFVPTLMAAPEAMLIAALNTYRWVAVVTVPIGFKITVLVADPALKLISWNRKLLVNRESLLIGTNNDVSNPLLTMSPATIVLLLSKITRSQPNVE